MVRASPFSVAALALAGGLGWFQPAHAAAATLALPMAATAGLAPLDSCQALPAAPAAGAGQTKAAALLGRQVSQLEVMRQQQASSAAASGAAGLVAGSLPEPGIGPGPAGLACSAGLGRPVAAALAMAPIRASAGSPDTILASKRLSVRTTPFDRDWDRVRGSGLGRRPAGIRFGTPDWAGLNAVNAWANAEIRYVDDRKLYGQADRWATAAETLQRRAGDCEDIAIVKLQLLAAQGVRREDMQLVIARDLVRGADHAVLVVRLGNRLWLLDNATDQVLDASQSYDYRPIMSFSGGKKWIHGY